MALPAKVGAMLGADMASKGLGGSGAPPDDEPSPDSAPGEDDGLEAILNDIDEKVPGLGELVHELIERMLPEED